MVFAFNNAFQAFIGESLGVCSAGFVKKWVIGTLTLALMVLPRSDQTVLSDLSNATLTFICESVKKFQHPENFCYGKSKVCESVNNVQPGIFHR